MIDFHTHVLPGIDDGSRNVETSLKMIRTMQEQGTDIICATPHFYASRLSPQTFLERRQASWELLYSKLPENSPQIMLGAEVLYYPGISRMEALPNLCLEGTNILLLEMPMSTWSRYTVTELQELASSGEFTLMIAHIERYYDEQKKNVWDGLSEMGVVMQSNARRFYQSLSSMKRATQMLRNNEIDVIGSDAHNLISRPPNMMYAERAIRKKLGNGFWKSLSGYAYSLLKYASVQ